MADKKSLSDLAELTKEPAAAPAEAEAQAPEAEAPAAPPPVQEAAPLREQQLDKYGRAYATGRRKDAIARVWLKPGSGKIVINGREQETYFARPTLRLVINQPFDVAERRGQYDVEATVVGGGWNSHMTVLQERLAGRGVKDFWSLPCQVARGGREGAGAVGKRAAGIVPTALLVSVIASGAKQSNWIATALRASR